MEVLITNYGAYIVSRYIDNELFEPQKDWSDEDFKRTSYAQSTANHILELMLDRPFSDPIDIAEMVLMKAINHFNLAKTESAKLVFSVMAETAEIILSLLKEDEYV